MSNPYNSEIPSFDKRFELDEMMLGYIDATLAGLVLTHGDEQTYTWESRFGSKRSIEETDRIFHRGEGMWLGKWRITDDIEEEVKSIFLIESPSIYVRATCFGRLQKDPRSLFFEVFNDAAERSIELDASVPELRRRSDRTEDVILKVPSTRYRLNQST